MAARALVLAALLLFTGCARALLPYKPDPQPRGARLSAAYTVVGDKLRIEIDTDRKPLEQAWILKPDGASVGPSAVDAAPVVTSPPPTISIGIGGFSWGRGVSVGSDTSAGIPVGSGASHVAGNTIVWFPLDAAGPAPWRVYVKVAGADPTTIAVGGPIPSR